MGEAKRKRLEARIRGEGVVAPGVPESVKALIAQVVRNVDWQLYSNDGPPGGLCWFRCATGMMVLRALGLPAALQIGGLAMRVGPRVIGDTIGFINGDGMGCRTENGVLAHYWIVSGKDLVDFSGGDWKHNFTTLHEHIIPGETQLPPLLWTAPDPPEYVWRPWKELYGRPRMLALGEYRYTGFIGPKPPWQDMLDDVKPYLEIVRMHLQRTLTRLRAMLAAPAEAHK